MNTAQPASLPPAPRSSGGISRSTAAWTVAASSAMKNCHGPGRQGLGGFARLGLQGIAPVMIRALAETELTRMEAAEASKARREIEIAVICFLPWIVAEGPRTLQCELPVLLSTPLVPEVPELPVVLGWAVPVLAAAPTALSPCGFDGLPVAGEAGEDAAGDPAFCRPASGCEGAPACAQ